MNENNQNSSLLTVSEVECYIVLRGYKHCLPPIIIDRQGSRSHSHKLTPREQFALASKISRFRIQTLGRPAGASVKF